VSTTAAANWTIAITLLAVGIALCWICRAHKRSQRWADTEHDVGPDSLRLLEELDAHLDAHVLADPQLSAGFDRLRQALRDHREEDR
jgi:C4-dicarboxylate-specific signal transduction histidine kinase